MEKLNEEAAALERARRDRVHLMCLGGFLLATVCAVVALAIGYQFASVTAIRGERNELLATLTKLQDGCKLSLLQTVDRISLREMIIDRFLHDVLDWKARKP